MLSSFKAVQNMGVFSKYIVSSRAKVSTVLASATCIQLSNSYTSGLPIQSKRVNLTVSPRYAHPQKVYQTNPRSCPLHRALKRPCRFIWMHQRSSRESNGAPKSAPRVAFEGLPGSLQALHLYSIMDQLRRHHDLQERKERGRLFHKNLTMPPHNTFHNHYM